MDAGIHSFQHACRLCILYTLSPPHLVAPEARMVAREDARIASWGELLRKGN